MIISNATPLINFSMIGELGILKQLFNTIVVPEAVWYEIVIKGEGYPTARAIRQSDFLSRQRISNTTLFHTLSMKQKLSSWRLKERRNWFCWTNWKIEPLPNTSG